MFIVTRIWISISDLDLNSIIESHNENLKNLLNFIIIIKMANGMGSFAFFGFISRPWHFWAHINYHCDPFDTRTPNFYFLGWFSDLFFGRKRGRHVEVQRATEWAQPSWWASGDSISKTGEQSSLMEAISIGIQERSSFQKLYTIF